VPVVLSVASSLPSWVPLVTACGGAVGAAAGLAGLLSARRDRRAERRPDFRIDTRLSADRRQLLIDVTNVGGPATNVHLEGFTGPFVGSRPSDPKTRLSWISDTTPPRRYWTAGEHRVLCVDVNAPPNAAWETRILATGWDLKKRTLFVSTPFGGSRWVRGRRARRLSRRPMYRADSVWGLAFRSAPSFLYDHVPLRALASASTWDDGAATPR
jgi:hypothetical protein